MRYNEAANASGCRDVYSPARGDRESANPKLHIGVRGLGRWSRDAGAALEDTEYGKELKFLDAGCALGAAALCLFSIASGEAANRLPPG